jgi:ketosteroid isomerase-like protein
MTTSFFRYSTALLVILACSACASAPPAASEADITKVVDTFYGSMKKGDKAAVMSVLAPDALFVESGKLETRAEYEANHLPADIEFESQVTGTRAPMKITFHDDKTAWVVATTEYHGTFEGNPVNFASAQLMVLTRPAEGGDWSIRSAHWSSRRLD